MRLVRLANMQFSEDIGSWRNFLLKIGGLSDDETSPEVEVGAIVIYGKQQDKPIPGSRIAVAAIVDLTGRPSVDSNGRIEVPVEPRREAENALEAVANMISVATHSQRTISSPHPHVLLMPESDEDRTLLATATEIAEGGTIGMVWIGRLDIPLTLMLEATSDRLDGVALIAEALSQSHPVGRFREYIRFFERAFDCGPKRLKQPLAQFLSSARSNYGYTATELAQWFAEVRDQITHGAREELLYERDVRPMAVRAEQAAYEVLLNKAEWRATNAKHRDMWQPDLGTMSSNAIDTFIIQGTTPPMKSQLLDGLRAFPIDLGLSFNPAGLPPEWWYGSTNQPSDT